MANVKPSEVGKQKFLSKRTPGVKERFLAEYEQSGNLARAARMAEINRHLHYEWLGEDPEYVRAFTQAHEKFRERLEEELYNRSVVGETEDVWFQGKKVGTQRRKSDILLMFAMKKHIAEYRDSSSTNVSMTANVQSNVSINLTKIAEDDLNHLISTLESAASAEESRSLIESGVSGEDQESEK